MQTQCNEYGQQNQDKKTSWPFPHFKPFQAVMALIINITNVEKVISIINWLIYVVLPLKGKLA